MLMFMHLPHSKKTDDDEDLILGLTLCHCYLSKSIFIVQSNEVC